VAQPTPGRRHLAVRRLLENLEIQDTSGCRSSSSRFTGVPMTAAQPPRSRTAQLDAVELTKVRTALPASLSLAAGEDEDLSPGLTRYPCYPQDGRLTPHDLAQLRT